MRLGNQADSQFWFGASGIQSRCVKNDQSLFEQGVGNVDQRVPPFGHFDQAPGVNHRVILGKLAVPVSKGSCFILSDPAGFGHFFQRLGKLLGIVDIQLNPCPFLRGESPFHQCLCG